MLNIIGKRKIWFAISGTLVVASIISILVFGLKQGIDFTGGSLLRVSYPENRPEQVEITSTLADMDLGSIVVQPLGEKELLIRTKALNEDVHQEVLVKLGDVEELSFETVGPTIGKELRSKSLMAIALVLLGIILYIAFTFRKVSRPVRSWVYGLVAITALFHDVLIPTGVVAILGKFVGFEIDVLFVTALLTILGFSVHDTIVVFDRIRENLQRKGGENFEELVNNSVNQIITRSVNTSLTTLLVLGVVYLFGGDSTQNFILVLLMGIALGTYSSIFLASPLLVAWHKRMQRE